MNKKRRNQISVIITELELIKTKLNNVLSEKEMRFIICHGIYKDQCVENNQKKLLRI